jgi:DNA-binding IclR family transcriptional regulator
MSSSASRTLGVLDHIARSERPPGVTEIARSLSLSPASVFRSLDALLRAGLISRYRESSRYVPGPAAERLRHDIVARFPMREACLPYLRQLASISGENVSLYVRVGWFAVRICSVAGMSEVTGLPVARRPTPLGETAAGKAILAVLPKAQIAAYRKWATSLPKSRSAGGAITFAVRVGERAVGAVSIETGTPITAEQRKGCSQVIANIEALASAQPALFSGPFEHLDPNQIVF